MVIKRSKRSVSNPAPLSGLCRPAAEHVPLSATAGAPDGSTWAPAILARGYRSLTYTFLPLCLRLRKRDDRSPCLRGPRAEVSLRHCKARRARPATTRLQRSRAPPSWVQTF